MCGCCTHGVAGDRLRGIGGDSEPVAQPELVSFVEPELEPEL